jgi:hypothetical protein
MSAAAAGGSAPRRIFNSLGELVNRSSSVKGKCLFDLVYGLSDNGVGRKVTRTTWRDAEKNFVTLTRVQVHAAQRTLLKRGTAYGVLTWNGVAEPTERRLTSTCKRDWRWALTQPVVLPRFAPTAAPKTPQSSETSKQ